MNRQANGINIYNKKCIYYFCIYYIYIGGLMGYIYIYPKKLQFAAYGQFVLVCPLNAIIDNNHLCNKIGIF